MRTRRGVQGRRPGRGVQSHVSRHRASTGGMDATHVVSKTTDPGMARVPDAVRPRSWRRRPRPPVSSASGPGNAAREATRAAGDTSKDGRFREAWRLGPRAGTTRRARDARGGRDIDRDGRTYACRGHGAGQTPRDRVALLRPAGMRRYACSPRASSRRMPSRGTSDCDGSAAAATARSWISRATSKASSRSGSRAIPAPDRRRPSA